MSWQQNFSFLPEPQGQKEYGSSALAMELAAKEMIREWTGAWGEESREKLAGERLALFGNQFEERLKRVGEFCEPFLHQGLFELLHVD